jgi:hypothetical protein
LISWIEWWLRGRSRAQALFHSILALVFIGFADWITGPAVGFSIFYVFPVMGVTWRLGKRPGVMMALGCAAVWALVDKLGRTELAGWVPIWNFGVSFLLFSLISLVLSRIKEVIAKQSALMAELRLALDEVNRLTGLLRVCAWCRRIKNDDGVWEPMEKYLSEHADVHFTHGICGECMAKHHPDVDVPNS